MTGPQSLWLFVRPRSGKGWVDQFWTPISAATNPTICPPAGRPFRCGEFAMCASTTVLLYTSTPPCGCRCCPEKTHNLPCHETSLGMASGEPENAATSILLDSAAQDWRSVQSQPNCQSIVLHTSSMLGCRAPWAYLITCNPNGNALDGTALHA